MIPLSIRVAVAIAALAAFALFPHLAPSLQLALWDGGRAPMQQFGTETWIAAGAPHAPAGWFGDAVVARIGPRIGLRGLGIAAALAFTFALGIVEDRARARGGALFGALAVLLAFSTALSDFHVGDGLATDTLFTALVLAALDRGGRRQLLAIPAIFAWAWFSPHALLGVLFVAATVAGLAFEARVTRDPADTAVRETGIVALGSAAALLATPATIGYIGASIAALHLDGAKTPWTIHPGDIAPLAYHSGFTALLLIAVAVGGTYGSRAFEAVRAAHAGTGEPVPHGASGFADAAVLGCAIVLGFVDGHLLPVAGIAAAPVLAGAAARRFGEPRIPRIAPLAIVAAGVLGLLAAVVADSGKGPVRLDATTLVDRIALDPTAHALYCSTPVWCDGALGSPVRVGVDSRTGWPETAITDQTTVATVGPHWYRILERGKVDRIVAFKTTALAGLIRLRHDWHPIGEDGRVEAFARTLPAGTLPAGTLR